MKRGSETQSDAAIRVGAGRKAGRYNDLFIAVAQVGLIRVHPVFAG